MFVSLFRSAQGQCQLDVESGQTDLQLCSKSVNDWLTRGVWSAVAVSAILMAFQVIYLLSIYLSIFVCYFLDIPGIVCDPRLLLQPLYSSAKWSGLC